MTEKEVKEALYYNNFRFKVAEKIFKTENKKYNITLIDIQNQCSHSKTSHHTGMYEMPSYTECNICGKEI